MPPRTSRLTPRSIVRIPPSGKRPKAAIRPMMAMLRCGPSNQPFTATAKSAFNRTHISRDEVGFRCGCTKSKPHYLLSNCAVGGWNGRQGQKKFALVTLPTANSPEDSHVDFDRSHHVDGVERFDPQADTGIGLEEPCEPWRQPARREVGECANGHGA